VRSKILPSHCIPSRPLKSVDGLVVHYFSAKNVNPDNLYDMGICRDLFVDLNLPRAARRHYMKEATWPAERMYASAHLLIGRDGEVWKLVEYDQEAYHAGASILNGRADCNKWTLGVELVGTINSGFERVQYESLARLVIELEARFGFPKEAIAGHDQVRWAAIEAGSGKRPKYDPSGRKDGEGDNFDWWYFGKLANDYRGERADPDDPELAAKADAAARASQPIDALEERNHGT